VKLKTKILLGLSKVCGAKNRRGQPCQCKRLFRGGRCRFHGGLSTGPKTPEGKARALEALRRWRLRSSSWHRGRVCALWGPGISIPFRSCSERWSPSGLGLRQARPRRGSCDPSAIPVWIRVTKGFLSSGWNGKPLASRVYACVMGCAVTILVLGYW